MLKKAVKFNLILLVLINFLLNQSWQLKKEKNQGWQREKRNIPYGSKPYYCDTKEKINEILNIKNNLKRLIRYDKNIYFVLKNRIIFTKVPVLKREDFTDDNLLFVDFFYEQEKRINFNLPDLPKEATVFGHIDYSKIDHSFNNVQSNEEPKNQINTVKQVEELFFIDLNSTTNLIVNHSILLNFHSKKLAGKNKAIKLNEIYLKLDNKWVDENYESKSKYFYMIKMNSEFILFKYDLWSTFGSIDRQNKTILVQIGHTKSNDRKEHAIIRISDFPDVKPFIIYVTNSPENRSEQNSTEQRVTFFGIDETNFLIHIKNFQFFYNLSISKRLDIKDSYTINLDFDELMSCRTRFTKDQQVKGIYFNNGTFFIFIKRFFLKIENDLVSNGFHLNDNVYETNAYELEVDSDSPGGFADLRYEIINRKWVKIFNQSTIALIFKPTISQVYRLNLLNNDQQLNNDLLIEYDQYLATHFFKHCKKHLITFENRFSFCFNEDSYSYFGDLIDEKDKLSNEQISSRLKNRHSIQSIFENSTVEWNQKLKLIINYKSNQFIFMTQTYLFIFDYDQFEISSDKRLYSKYKSNSVDKIDNLTNNESTTNSNNNTKQFIKIENCFYQISIKCSHKSEQVPLLNNMTNVERSEVQKEYESYFKYYIICILFALSLLVVLFVRRNHSKKKSVYIIKKDDPSIITIASFQDVSSKGSIRDTNSKKSNIDSKKSNLDSKKSNLDSKRSIQDSKRSTRDSKRSVQESKRSIKGLDQQSNKINLNEQSEQFSIFCSPSTSKSVSKTPTLESKIARSNIIKSNVIKSNIIKPKKIKPKSKVNQKLKTIKPPKNLKK